MSDLNDVLGRLRGQDYIEAVSTLAVLAAAKDSRLLCAFCAKKPASYIGMHACGEPGGTCCQNCLDHQRDWLDTAFSIADAAPYCRHCDTNTDRGHIYAVELFTKGRVTM